MTHPGRLLTPQLGAEYPDTDRGIRVGIRPLKEIVVGGAGSTLWLLFGAVLGALVAAGTFSAIRLLAPELPRLEEIGCGPQISRDARRMRGFRWSRNEPE